jgi:transporter family protein
MPFSQSPELLALCGAFFAALAQVTAKRSAMLARPEAFLAARWLTSLLLYSLLATLLGAWGEFRFTPEFAYLLLGALTGPVLAWNLYTRAIRLLDISIAYPISQTFTLGSLLLAVLFLGEVPTIYAFVGAVLIILGVAVIYGRPGGLRPSRISTVGLLLIVATALLWALNYLVWKISLIHFSVLQANWTRVAVPAAVMLLVVAWSSRRTRADRARLKLSGPALLYAAATALLADLLGFGFQFAALQAGQLSTVVPIVNSSPLFLVALSTLLLGERPSRRSLGGIGLIILGVWLVAALGRGS